MTTNIILTYIDSLSDPDPDVFLNSVWQLGLIGPAAQAAVPALVESLNERNSYIKIRIIYTLGKIGPAAQTAVPALIESLSDPDDDIRLNAALALSLIGSAAQTAVPALIESLSDPERLVRIYAACALGEIGSAAQAAIPALVKSTSDPDRDVRMHSAEAITYIGSATDLIAQGKNSGSKDLDIQLRAAKLTKQLKLFYLVGRLHYEEGAESLNEAGRRLGIRQQAKMPDDDLPSSSMSIKRYSEALLDLFSRILHKPIVILFCQKREGLAVQFMPDCKYAWEWTASYLKDSDEVGPNWWGIAETRLTVPPEKIPKW
jgi:HEAT repeat protein